mgnify:CR=1 FL=1|tara:strand:- start:785 stop:1225 length:441 start_codon:yes stop_codon:yes gene_type:complete
MNILALDVATKTGFCHDEDSGVWDFSLKRDESSGMRLIKFGSLLAYTLVEKEIDLVVFERSAGRHQNAVIVQSELHGVLKHTCETLKVDYRAYSASEIKKFATGKGNAKKPEMIQACKDNYDINPIDDNEADAVHIYMLAKRDYPT